MPILTKTTDTLFHYFESHEEINLESFASQIIFEIPSKQINTEIQKDIFDKFFSIGRPNNLSKISFMYEDANDGFLFSYTIGHYQKAVLDFKMSTQNLKKNASNQFIKIDDSNSKVNETGISFKVNIANQKSKKNEKEPTIQSSYNKLIDKISIAIIDSPEKILS